ncbi:polynucleotide adenylyltransferase PcnB [Treponema sp.]|uniref:polynucleotide adenylyltransferase PcnB n=1 Tax=Treponema sp. TaxID=166 RepID=UPI00257F64B3|nr:polynucleotide adenylyltransferase PcnB [Treponema sp.]MBE6353890.1 polynucleotide adenylyltransferase PcnB [Treponema sp.]
MLFRYGTDEKGRPVKKAVIYTKEEHNIQLSSIDSDALFVISRLRDNGFSAYIVGGAVRDLLIGKTPKDFDIVTDATPSRIKRIFRNSRIIGKRFRLVHVFFGQKIFEVSTFRSTVAGSVGNTFGTMDEDVMRRDFSLNALYYDPFRQQIIDYVNGVKDIRAGVVKPIIPLDRIFVEDPVRMLRAVKYSSTTKCSLPRSLKKKIRESSSLLSPVSPSRLTEEVLKIINCGHSFEVVSAALDTDLYIYLQPAATNLMLENRKYAAAYLESLKELDKEVTENPDMKLGDKLYFILKDFVSSLTDWSKEPKTASESSELFKRTWARCRNFVLPMNPQRTELEYAVVKILKSLGVSFKESKRRRRSQESSENQVSARKKRTVS